ncbi:MAG: hypothetical protein H6696_16075 [Deferribacteres bacterium]|nr:hypothetical protein [candidate division KSB1 bacterium]MCB9503449.1 hypothetical protein [Deferribacteres bacterium]
MQDALVPVPLHRTLLFICGPFAMQRYKLKHQAKKGKTNNLHDCPEENPALRLYGKIVTVAT